MSSIFAFLSLLLNLGTTQAHAVSEPPIPERCSKETEEKTEKKFGSYRIKISYSDERMCQHLDILKNGRSIFHEEGFDHHYYLGDGADRSHKLSVILPEKDSPSLVVKRWTGGHCCTSLLIFILGKEFRKIPEIYGGDSDPEVIDLDHDGVSEIRVLDNSLAYLFSSYASSAKGEVILKYQQGRYSIASELMKKPPPAWKSLIAKIPGWQRQLRYEPGLNWPPPSLIQTVTDLVFTGNEAVAFNLIDLVWPSDLPGKAKFIRAYRNALDDSKYYTEFKQKKQKHTMTETQQPKANK